ncbi:MAG: hypothetical protein IJU57_00475 [Clostridia bacterium]|nr:hypothetical protein [Clostridia bacterium]
MKFDKERFFSILSEIRSSGHERYNIGTLKEKTMHLALKRYFEADESFQEIETNGFVADIRKDGIIYEIETGGFSGLKPKLEAYLDEYTVWLVLPLSKKKNLQWLDPLTGELSKKRTSPLKANEYDILFELVRILPYVSHPNLHVLGIMMETDELRIADGWSENGKKGSHRVELIPSDIYYVTEFSCDSDYEKYIPPSCNMKFTVKDFAEEAGSILEPRRSKIDKRTASAVIKVLEARGLIVRTGKAGKAYTYSRARTASAAAPEA